MNDMEYKTNVVTGEALKAMSNEARGLEKRDCFGSLMKYLKSQCGSRVCVLYGLRRTGKTTMLQQAIGEMPLSECAYLKAKTTDTMAVLNSDLKLLYKNGFRYIFIDEVTLLEDFIDSAALFSDIFAAQGMKIVLSGTDSLGFWLTLNRELYDRAATIHTTFIPFHEHSRLLKINDLDEYIRFGGTLRAGETDFDDKELFADGVSFRDDESTRRYIDTAICQNIQNSLVFYENGGHFRHLYDLYKAGELTNAINRIVEDINHRFAADTIINKFKSHDLGTAAANLRKERNEELRTDIFDRIDRNAVTERLMAILDIRNQENITIGITEAHSDEIKEYLDALDLIVNCPIESTTPKAEPLERIVFTQPGMRFCQAQALVHSLMKDEVFSEASEHEKKIAADRLLDEVRGRMTEDIVLLETSQLLGKKFKVFKLQFARGEMDMVIYNPDSNSCEVYEVKHSTEAVPDQYQHLVDSDKCALTEQRFGKITKRTVLYNGEDFTEENGIEYRNVSEYLKHLPQFAQDLAQSDDPLQGMNFGM